MSVVKNLVVRAGADFSGLNKGLSRAQKQVELFKTSVTKSMAAVGAAIATIGAGASITDAVRDSIKMEGAIQSLNRILGQSASDFDAWAKSQATAFGMSKLEAMDYGRTFAIMTKSFAENSAQQTKYTINMLKAAATVASMSGRTVQDVMERLASGLRGETDAVEDLGIQVSVAMIESTAAFKKFANGKSWAQLSVQTQQQIRYFAILEQAAAIYGTELADNTGTKVNQFTANLKNLKVALGDAFIPVLNAILLPLTSFIQRVQMAMEYVAAFSRSLFGMSGSKAFSSTNSQAQAVSEIADSANEAADGFDNAKKAQNGFLAGFDEINSISKSDAGKSGVGSGKKEANSKTVSSLGIGNDFQNGMQDIASKAEAMAERVRNAFETIKSVISAAVPYVVAALAGLGIAFAAYYLQVNGATIVTKTATLAMSLLSRGLLIVQGAMTGFSAAIAAITSPLGIIILSIAALTAACVYFYQTNEEFRGVVDKIFKDISVVIQSLWKLILIPLGTFLKEVFKIAWDGITASLTQLKPVLSAIGTALSFLWKSIMVPFILWASKNISNTFVTIFEGINGAVGGAIDALKGFIKFLKGVFYNDNKMAWEGVRDMISGIFSSLTAIIKTPINIAIDAINTLIDGVNSITNLPDWITGGKKTMSIPKIPRLAQGGIVSSPTMAMVGEAGSELIMPLENTSFVDKMASALGSAVMSAMQINGGTTNKSGDVVLKIDGNTIARVLNPYLNKESARIGGSMISIS